jgi:hypothetical protein
MSTWTPEELRRIDASDELEIATRRRDGTLRRHIPVWVVRQGGGLYVRAVNGRDAAWFRGAQARHEGHVRAGGVEKEVSIVDADPDLADAIDAAYRAKYARYPSIVPHVLNEQARAATVALVPED